MCFTSPGLIIAILNFTLEIQLRFCKGRAISRFWREKAVHDLIFPTLICQLDGGRSSPKSFIGMLILLQPRYTSAIAALDKVTPKRI